jgi:hypothetical protein
MQDKKAVDAPSSLSGSKKKAVGKKMYVVYECDVR